MDGGCDEGGDGVWGVVEVDVYVCCWGEGVGVFYFGGDVGVMSWGVWFEEKCYFSEK